MQSRLRASWLVRLAAVSLSGWVCGAAFCLLPASDGMLGRVDGLERPSTQGPLTLASRLARASAGDWALLQVQDQTIAWRLDHDGEARVLEEWAVPSELLESWGTQSDRWVSWMAQDGPGASSRAVYRWQIQTGWSIWQTSVAGWQPLDEHGTLLKALFELPLSAVPPCHQRRCGPRPRAGIADERPVWRPTAGRDLSQVEVWTGSLATDAEGGSVARVTLWTASESESKFPSAFPLHAEIERLGVRFACRLLAAGKQSPALDLSTPTPPTSSSP